MASGRNKRRKIWKGEKGSELVNDDNKATNEHKDANVTSYERRRVDTRKTEQLSGKREAGPGKKIRGML